MPRSKKSAGQPPTNPEPDGDAHDAAETEGMAHVRADELAGSPDVFARKKEADAEPPASEPQTIAEPEPDAAEPAATATNETGETVASDEPVAEPIEPPPPPPPPPFTPAPPPVYAPMAAPAPRRSGSGVAIGVVLVVVGLFYLIVTVAGIDLSSFGWPLFVIIPGLTLLVVGFVSLGTGAAIPGGILTMVGLVLAYQNSTGYWTSWAYAWALVAPGGVGLGLFLQGLRERNPGLIRQGRSLMLIALLIFLVLFVFFESILNISNINNVPLVRAALPALFIVLGILLLARSIQNSRKRSA